MNLVSVLIAKWRNKRIKSKLESAEKIIEEAGYTVCKIVNRAGTDYIIDSTGAFHKIGRKA